MRNTACKLIVYLPTTVACITITADGTSTPTTNNCYNDVHGPTNNWSKTITSFTKFVLTSYHN